MRLGLAACGAAAFFFFCLCVEAADPKEEAGSALAYLRCRGAGALLLYFYNRPERVCVRGPPASTVGQLTSTLGALAGSSGLVAVRHRGFFRRVLLGRRRINSEKRLEALGRRPLEVYVQDGALRAALDARFVYVLPRIDEDNVPLLDLESVSLSPAIDSVLELLSPASHVAPSWLASRARCGPSAARLLQPSEATLSRLFPNRQYKRVVFRDAETGLLKFCPARYFAFPSKQSTYFCGAKIPLRLSPLGKAQILQAFSGPPEGGPGRPCPEASVLLMRRPRDIQTEQDPTLVLVQWTRGHAGEAIVQETVIHAEPWFAAVSVSVCLLSPGSGFLRNYTADNSRLLSRLGGVFARLLLTRCFLWKLTEMANIDLEEAFSAKVARSEGDSFRSLQQFFMRPISYEVLRPIDYKALVVSPADSVIQNAFFVTPNEHGEIIDAHIPQVKGTTFNLSEFLFGRGTDKEIRLQSPKNKLFVQIFYLAPADYHRFHSAADWLATRHVYIPGCLPSVRRSVLLNRNLLDAFERTSVQGHWSPGNTGGPRLFFSMTFVAAMLVGGIELFYRKTADANRFTFSPACSALRSSMTYEYQEPVPLCMGQELGAFKFGSTVVLAFEAPEDFQASAPVCEHVDVGSTTGHLPGRPRRTLARCDFTYGNHASALDYLQHLQSLVSKQKVTSAGSSTAAADSSAVPIEPHDYQAGLEETDSSGGVPPLAAAPAAEEAAGQQQQQQAELRGIEETEAPLWWFLGERPLRQRARVRQVQGEETQFSSLADVGLKVKSLEVALFRRYALARWLAAFWRDPSSSGCSVLLQRGQLTAEQTDSSGSSVPVCYYDVKSRSLLLRFAGQQSSLLLMLPAEPHEAFLLRYPNFACASAKGFGKASRGISASWKLTGGDLRVSFTLSLTHWLADETGAVGLRSFAFEAAPQTASQTLASAVAMLAGGEPGGIGETPPHAEAVPGLLHFSLSPPRKAEQAEESLQQFFISSGRDALELPPNGRSARSELGCSDSPFFRFLSAVSRRVRGGFGRRDRQQQVARAEASEEA
ncbi:hypothetical protein Efla_002370 [Eimeria flavescens]